MVSLEQVKLLESKVTKTIEYVKKVTEENSRLKAKLDSNQKRIDELEVLIHQFKDEQSRIEDGILSALDRLNQFEDAVETVVSSKPDTPKDYESKADTPKADTPAPAKKESRKGKEASTSADKPDPDLSLGNDNRTSQELDIF